jgi:hypothetical protein
MRSIYVKDDRKRVEMLFAHLTRILRLGGLRLREPPVTILATSR